MHFNEDTFWKTLPYLLPVIAYILGWVRDKWRLPKPIAKLLANKAVMALIVQGVAEGAVLSGLTGDQRREYVREWAKGQLHNLVGEVVSDSAINFLIEKVVADRKAAE